MTQSGGFINTPLPSAESFITSFLFQLTVTSLQLTVASRYGSGISHYGSNISKTASILAKFPALKYR